MIIHDRSILFVHVPKTAGQSVTRFLFDNIGEKTSFKFPKYGLIKNKKLKQDGPQNYHHLYLDEYIELGLLAQDEIEKYYKFCITRNPYDRFISAFYFNDLDKQYTCYKDFVREIPTNERNDICRHFVPQTKFISSSLGIKIDKIFKLERDIPEVFEQSFLEKYNFKLPLSASNSYKRKKDKMQLDQYTIDFIKDFYSDDFVQLGYSF